MNSIHYNLDFWFFQFFIYYLSYFVFHMPINNMNSLNWKYLSLPFLLDTISSKFKICIERSNKISDNLNHSVKKAFKRINSTLNQTKKWTHLHYNSYILLIISIKSVKHIRSELPHKEQCNGNPNHKLRFIWLQ